MSTATLVFELALQRLSNGTVPLKARIIFKRKKVERLVIRIPDDQLGNWDNIKSRFKSSAPPFYNKILSDWQQKFDKFLSDNYFELSKLEVEQIAEIFDIEADPTDIFLLTCLKDYYEVSTNTKGFSNETLFVSIHWQRLKRYSGTYRSYAVPMAETGMVVYCM